MEGNPNSTSFKVNLNAYDAGMYYLNVNNKIMKVIKKQTISFNNLYNDYIMKTSSCKIV